MDDVETVVEYEKRELCEGIYVEGKIWNIDNS